MGCVNDCDAVVRASVRGLMSTNSAWFESRFKQSYKKVETSSAATSDENSINVDECLIRN